MKRRGDLLEELTATIMTGGDLKTSHAKILKKKVPGGAFSPRRESLGILQDFMRKQKQVSQRCYMYMHTASSASESMNRANKAARSRLAVDVVSSSRLLLQLCASRYQEKKELA